MLINSELFKFGYNYKKQKNKIKKFHLNVFSDKKYNIYTINKMSWLDSLKSRIKYYL